MRRWSARIDPNIEQAISEAVKAGVFRRAARLNPGSARIWNALAEPHSRRVATILDDIIGRRSKNCGWSETF